jgi:tetratricopeptide (TPR) repeat protein
LGQLNFDEQLEKLDSAAFVALENNEVDAFQKANNLLQKSLDSKLSIYRVNAYTILGIISKNRGYYLSSLDYYLKALAASKALNDQRRVSACLNNIGTVYQLQRNFSKAIEYFYQSVELEKKFNDQLQMSIRYYNLGECYKDIDSLDIALSYFNNSLIIEKKKRNNEGIVYAELGIADVYLKIGRPKDAHPILNKVEKRIQKDQIEEKIIFLKLMSNYFIAIKQYDQAFIRIDKAIELSEKSELRNRLPELLKIQMGLLEIKHDFERATMVYKKFVRLTEQLNDKNVQDRLDDLTFRNELVKKQLEIDLVEEERNRATENEEKERLLRVYTQKMVFFVLFLLLFVFGLIVFGIRKITKER